jgi:hypothetical protein
MRSFTMLSPAEQAGATLVEIKEILHILTSFDGLAIKELPVPIVSNFELLVQEKMEPWELKLGKNQMIGQLQVEGCRRAYNRRYRANSIELAPPPQGAEVLLQIPV